MRIIDPQSAVLTNIEVLAYLSANPPRRPPGGPPNSRRWVPSPDLRDHNTVVKEIHNYVTRISPHLLKYPRHTPRPSSSHSQSQSHTQAAMTGTMRPTATTTTTTMTQTTETPSIPPPIPSSEQTPMDRALRDLIAKLLPYGLTKAEVVMILNLGLGLRASTEGGEQGREEMVNGDGEEMDVDEEAAEMNGAGGEGEEGEGGEEDFGALALFDTVVEEREDRIAEEDVPAILGIIRETLAENYGA